MIYKEEHRDVFSVSSDYILCHCISSDFALEAGIAEEFTKRGVKQELMDKYIVNHWCGVGYALTTHATDFESEISLVTKERFWQKPTLKTVREALQCMRKIVGVHSDKNIIKIAMPKIGCGLDKLKWEDVSEIIKDVFKDTDMEILVCIK